MRDVTIFARLIVHSEPADATYTRGFALTYEVHEWPSSRMRVSSSRRRPSVSWIAASTTGSRSWSKLKTDELASDRSFWNM
jgi:hypothetical protein